MKLSTKRVKFTTALAKLILEGERLGLNLAIDQTKRCKDCKSTIKYSCHKFGLAADIVVYLGDMMKYYDGEDLTIINPHIVLHDYWDTLGGSKRIPHDMNHYSFEHNGFR